MKCAVPKMPVALWLRAKIGVCAVLFLGTNICSAQTQRSAPRPADTIAVGAERFDHYLPALDGKRVALVTNPTGMVGKTHVVDTLLALGVNIVKVFAPEHGFRGSADAGEHIADENDPKTGVPIISLYGKSKKPSREQMHGVDVVVFDIQDVGVRFFTYVSTMHLVMEACATSSIPFIVLDRPNPNGFYVDGPVLQMKHRSFVGMHPVPIVHGMTLGEFATMINGEGWLEGGMQCELFVVRCEGYDHQQVYELPVRPSPNLPNMAAIHLYPALGLFEGTIVSVGRGTELPFQCIGYPGSKLGTYTFTPRPMPGAKDPPYSGQECIGLDLSEYGMFYTRLAPKLALNWLIGMYQQATDKSTYFNSYFDKLAGGPALREHVMQGWDEERIRASWQKELLDFMRLRKKYLLYEDFY